MRVRVRGRGRNTEWALLGSGVFSNKEHILQTARELFLLCAFTSPQAGKFFFRGDVFKANYLQHAGLEPADLNLAKFLFTSRGALHGALVEGREGWLMGTSWLWGAAEDPADFSDNWASVSDGGFYMSMELWGWHNTGARWPKRVVWRRTFCHHSQTTWLIFNSVFSSHTLTQAFIGNTTEMLWCSYTNHTGFEYLSL